MIFQEALIIFYLLVFIGWVIGVIIWLIIKLMGRSGSGSLRGDSVERYDYMDANWLRYQYYNKGRTIQYIANDQNVSMITIKKWLDKLERGSEDISDVELDKTELSIIQKTKSKKKRICPYCRVTMSRLEESNTFQCPRCKKKFRDKY
jgi:hypothetical protein